MRNAHDRNERFSLLLHREVAQAIERDAGVLARGRRILRAAAAITKQTRFLVVGSQAVVGAVPEPTGALDVSMEARSTTRALRI